jgi:hypothetical protein
MRTFENIEFVASGGGRYIVFVDDIEISQHNAFHKAQERATNEQLKNPDSRVWFEQSLRVDLTLRTQEIGQPNEAPDVSDLSLTSVIL